MAEWLVLRLARAPEERVSWMRADARGQPLAAPQSGTLSQAASAAAGARLAVIVPSSDVLMAEVDLPVKSGVRVQQVVPFALEEQLAADIETLHFGLGERDERSGRTAVAVVTRALMDQWLGALSAAGLAPELMCTEAALLPDNPGNVVVMLEGDTLCVRRAGLMPQALPALDVGVALAAALGEDTAADNLIFYASPEDWQRRSAEVEALRSRCASLKVQLLNYGPLPLLAPQLPAGRHLNLLSNEYAPKRAFGAGARRWRTAAVLAAALFLLHVSGLTLQLQLQRHAERTLDDAIGSIARRAIPGDSGTGEVRERIEQRLLAAQSGAGQAGLIPALSVLAQALRSADGAQVQSLSFRDDGLDLKLQAHDAENLERVDQSLRSNGWQAQLTSGTNAGSAYEGHIQAQAPGTARVGR
ncbi:MAG TPA: type II secretion system protein GspL [Steroidobacteraceae bacterium]|jgi:general secretion pathway protein L|nr:type II secretion system protein GspL [Steroidobacteraceae bacterium]